MPRVWTIKCLYGGRLTSSTNDLSLSRSIRHSKYTWAPTSRYYLQIFHTPVPQVCFLHFLPEEQHLSPNPTPARALIHLLTDVRLVFRFVIKILHLLTLCCISRFDISQSDISLPQNILIKPPFPLIQRSDSKPTSFLLWWGWCWWWWLLLNMIYFLWLLLIDQV